MNFQTKIFNKQFSRQNSKADSEKSVEEENFHKMKSITFPCTNVRTHPQRNMARNDDDKWK